MEQEKKRAFHSSKADKEVNHILGRETCYSRNQRRKDVAVLVTLLGGWDSEMEKNTISFKGYLPFIKDPLS